MKLAPVSASREGHPLDDSAMQEVRLWVAVLMRAAADARGSVGSEKGLRLADRRAAQRDAQRFFRDGRAVTILLALGLSPFTASRIAARLYRER